MNDNTAARFSYVYHRLMLTDDLLLKAKYLMREWLICPTAETETKAWALIEEIDTFNEQ